MVGSSQANENIKSLCSTSSLTNQIAPNCRCLATNRPATTPLVHPNNLKLRSSVNSNAQNSISSNRNQGHTTISLNNPTLNPGSMYGSEPSSISSNGQTQHIQIDVGYKECPFHLLRTEWYWIIITFYLLNDRLETYVMINKCWNIGEKSRFGI